MTHRIGVIGSGSWGTALAVHLAHTGHEVRLWARDAALASEMAVSRENRGYLPGIELPAALMPTADMQAALDGAQFLVVAVPSHGVRGVSRAAAPHVPAGCAIVSATKGLEEGSLLRMSQVLRYGLPAAGDIVALSGPSFALELARKLPTALVAAGESRIVVESVHGALRVARAAALWQRRRRRRGARRLAQEHHRDRRRRRRGPWPGRNALAALITRGLAELSRLAVALGAERDTLPALPDLATWC